MASKLRTEYCKNQIKLIKERIASGNCRFGDKRLLKSYQDELVGKITGGKDW